ncbi:hypothetical protein ACIQ9Q_41805 [Streptomyces sp. NPDC094438]
MRAAVAADETAGPGHRRLAAAAAIRRPGPTERALAVLYGPTIFI